ncbi:hypothetical protein EMIHUDRAFT_198518 [Emiliania huxleyi CCMP1516]|uniref:ubiquitinyl hydrolase 1 n=2 Tax=Emiliania huxleyi TaxID=2903 RepID=A0A0D3I7F1_EMIH1|nr:hypothetical protein EMIHUDRAFT_198518 [Emiliania huxleyi CCMP1516]EOD07186.1 hypothetical protein EMIHUDRAFT_198518 [Emiliania huxleyi CCMP1516]|eukprot:XP_005759615.1 hypothetical protein EMIHUDRAFT_198518 [Emiliania huxleyi CCMP1516]
MAVKEPAQPFWCHIPSPVALTDLARALGATDATLSDVLGLEDDLLALLPSPCLALILIYPTRVGGSCGTVALLHALSNSTPALAVEPGSPLEELLSTPEPGDGEAALVARHSEWLANSTAVRAAHERCAELSTAAAAAGRQGRHYVALGRREKEAADRRAEEEKARRRAKAAEATAAKKEAKMKNNKAKKAPPAFKLEEERRARAAAEVRAQEERAARLAAEQEAARRAKREAAELAGAAEQAALREAAELAEAFRRSEIDAEEEALARRVSRCEEAVSSESAGGGDLMRRVDRLEASLGAAIEGRLKERVGAIERLIGPEAAEAAGQHLPVTEPLAAVSLADAGLDTGRPAPESTMGGETTCIVCFARVKSHAAVPCGHLCACGPCSELMRECPYCRSSQ